MYKIEKNVLAVSGKWQFLALQMEEGDSVVVANDVEAKCLKASIVRYVSKKEGYLVGTRARKQQDGTYRVWRMSEKIDRLGPLNG